MLRHYQIFCYAFSLVIQFTPKAAQQGFIAAQYKLATIYHFGRGVEVDDVIVLRRLTAQLPLHTNVVPLPNLLPRLLPCHTVYPVPTEQVQDTKLAFYWYSQVAESGYSTAQFNLAELYDSGVGTEKNLKQAIFWYAKAAQQMGVVGSGCPERPSFGLTVFCPSVG
jgi:TPR repeat protein